MKTGHGWRGLTRTRTLCKLLAGLVALTVIFHAASCGFFFCIRFPRALEFPHEMYHDIRDIYILAGKHSHHLQSREMESPEFSQMYEITSPLESFMHLHSHSYQQGADRKLLCATGGPRWMSRGVVEADKFPKLIPRIIHQTYKTSGIPSNIKVLMHSWRRQNEDWEIRFYDDEACMKFVQWEFPEYLEAYRSLSNNIERSDYFR